MKDKVLEILQREFPDIDFTASDELVTDGVIDSFTLTNLIATLMTELDVEIPYEEIVEENFNSVDAIAEMVERLAE